LAANFCKIPANAAMPGVTSRRIFSALNANLQMAFSRRAGNFFCPAPGIFLRRQGIHDDL
jgi:hypothetical protein